MDNALAISASRLLMAWYRHGIRPLGAITESAICEASRSLKPLFLAAPDTPVKREIGRIVERCVTR